MRIAINLRSRTLWFAIAVSAFVGYLLSNDSVSVGVILGVALFFVFAFFHWSGHSAAMRGHIANCETHAKEITGLLSGNKEAVASITKAEQNIVDALLQLTDDFDALGEERTGEQEEFDRLMSQAITMVLARPGLRSSVTFKNLEHLRDQA
jgi:hypothetical protein